MKEKTNKFYAGMIKASALAVLKAIASNNSKAIIAKAAKLVLLATKLNIVLQDVLSENVMLCIANTLQLLALKARSEQLKEVFIDMAFNYLFRTTYIADRASYEALANLKA